MNEINDYIFYKMKSTYEYARDQLETYKSTIESTRHVAMSREKNPVK